MVWPKQLSKRFLFALALAVSVPAWIYLIGPQLLRVPSDFRYTAEITSVDNFFDAEKGIFKGEQYSRSNFYYEVLDHQNSRLKVRNVFQVNDLSGNLIFQAEPEFWVDRRTGLRLDDSSGASAPVYLMTPTQLNSQSVFYFHHPSSLEPARMEFESQERLYGLRVLKFSKTNLEPVDQTAAMHFLPGVPEKMGVKLASGLELWVEPYSGHVVKMNDFSTDYFFYDVHSGGRLHDYNRFANFYTEDSVIRQVEAAKQAKWKLLLVGVL